MPLRLHRICTFEDYYPHFYSFMSERQFALVDWQTQVVVDRRSIFDRQAHMHLKCRSLFSHQCASPIFISLQMVILYFYPLTFTMIYHDMQCCSIYPWDWVGDDRASFRALQGGLLVAPILQQLILNREPVEVLDFADAVAAWPFRRIVPAHLKNDLKYTGKDYRAAFSFLEAGGVRKGLPRPLAADMQLLAESEQGLLESGAIARCPPLPGGKASREEILRQTVYGCRGDVCAPRSSP